MSELEVLDYTITIAMKVKRPIVIERSNDLHEAKECLISKKRSTNNEELDKIIAFMNHAERYGAELQYMHYRQNEIVFFLSFQILNNLIDFKKTMSCVLPE